MISAAAEIPAGLVECVQRAERLLGKDVRFNHEPLGPVHHVIARYSDGLVAIDHFDGRFAPHLFTVVEARHD